MKLITGIAAIVLPLLSVNAQPLLPLTVGDSAPAVTLGTVFNYNRNNPRLNAFKDQLVILDFMNTFCLSCIKALPEFNDLRHKYAGRVEIFMVTSEGTERAAKFMKSNQIAREVLLPFIVNDSLLVKLFPHTFVSHEAWIYNGVVVAITASDYVTAANIETILSGTVPSWQVKNDAGGYDYSQPLWQVNTNITMYSTAGNSYGSICTPHLNGVAVRNTNEVDSVTGIHTIRAVNFAIAELYQFLLPHRDNYPKSHIALDPAYADLFIFPDKGFRDRWDGKNTFCYEATFPPGTSQEMIDSKVKADLDAFLKVKSAFKTTATPCFELARDTGYKRKAEQESYMALSAMATKNDLVFLSAEHMVHQLNEAYWGIPFYNDISTAESTPILLPEQVLTDTATLSKELQKQGIILRKVTREVDMLFLIKQ